MKYRLFLFSVFQIRKYEDFDGRFNHIDIPYYHGQEVELLDLRNQNLRELPYKICSLINLEVLVLDGNQIPDIFSNSIRLLTNLETLSLRNNCLTSISYSIQQLRNLKILDVRDNEITDTPYFINQMPFLYLLYIK